MKDYQLTDWQDYWKVFDELIELLEKDNKEQIIIDFKSAQKYVNGMTDGWFEFKYALEKILLSDKKNMTAEQNEIVEFLISALNKSLSKHR